MNGANRFGVTLEPGPDAERRENALRAARERRGALVEARLLEVLDLVSFDEHHVERQIEQRARERGTDSAAADDQHVAVDGCRGEAGHRAVAAHAASVTRARPCALRSPPPTWASP